MAQPRLRLTSRTTIITALLMAPLLLAAKGEGCKGAGSETDGETGSRVTPDMEGDWALSWEDNLDVEITIGGAVYHESLGAQGGTITIDHNGTPISFDLDCAKPQVVCPSEIWPSSVSLDQRDANFPRNVYVTIPSSECDGDLVAAAPADCGAGTNNEECVDVCEGTVTQVDKVAFGRLNFDNDELTVFLGAGVATNGFNCALLGISVASLDVASTGATRTSEWEAVSFPSAEVITGFAGGCLWAGDVDDDGTIEAIVIGAKVRLSTSFSGEKQ